MNLSFAEKVVLVTGGTSGIGRAAAIAFAKSGAKVVVAGRREKEGNETVSQIRQAGGEAFFFQSDVTKEESVKALIGETVGRYGRLDAAFNNAGLEETPNPLHEETLDIYNAIMDANVKSVFLSMKYEIAHMLKQGGGSIVNNSSIAGVIGFPGASIYTGAKHAVLGLTKAAALENAKSGIRINAVNPAAVETDMFNRFTGANEGLRQQMEAMHPVGRVGRPEEIAQAVLYLSSDAASFITGQSITIDGGFTAQ